MLRTHTCGEIQKKDASKTVTLSGWVHRLRDHGTLTFVHLRDRYGLTQLVHNESLNPVLHKELQGLNREDCIQVTGKVKARDPKDINQSLPTGEIEVVVESLTILNASKVPPFEIEDRAVVSDDLRLKYRYLDLRRPRMQHNLELRHRLRDVIRRSLIQDRFLEIETPLFIRTTPEGARDFIVPSRLYPGKVYSLPQSPQLYKQLLMMSGFDRYFQFAPCFRDEDLRADRAFVHTQIDMEMTFVEESDVFNVVETYLTAVYKEILNIPLSTPFPKMAYADAIANYGVDKPDLRFDMKIQNITSISSKSEMPIFQETAAKEGSILCLVVPGEANLSRKHLDGFGDFVKIYGARGIYYCKVADKGFETGVAKHFSEPLQAQIRLETQANSGDLLLIVAEPTKIAFTALGQLRNKLGKDLNLIKSNVPKFVWIRDFPLFEWNTDLNKWDPTHHIFTMPSPETTQYMDKDPGKVHGILYDLVLNGVELLSGSIRINRPDIQRNVFNVIQMSEAEAESKFGFLLKALEYGAPPHGGCAMGFDRLVAMLAGEESIREVVAFPHNASGIFPLDGSPSEPDATQLNELKLHFQKS